MSKAVAKLKNILKDLSKEEKKELLKLIQKELNNKVDESKLDPNISKNKKANNKSNTKNDAHQDVKIDDDIKGNDDEKKHDIIKKIKDTFKQDTSIKVISKEYGNVIESELEIANREAQKYVKRKDVMNKIKPVINDFNNNFKDTLNDTYQAICFINDDGYGILYKKQDNKLHNYIIKLQNADKNKAVYVVLFKEKKDIHDFIECGSLLFNKKLCNNTVVYTKQKDNYIKTELKNTTLIFIDMVTNRVLNVATGVKQVTNIDINNINFNDDDDYNSGSDAVLTFSADSVPTNNTEVTVSWTNGPSTAPTTDDTFYYSISCVEAPSKSQTSSDNEGSFFDNGAYKPDRCETNSYSSGSHNSEVTSHTIGSLTADTTYDVQVVSWWGTSSTTVPNFPDTVQVTTSP